MKSCLCKFYGKNTSSALCLVMTIKIDQMDLKKIFKTQQYVTLLCYYLTLGVACRKTNLNFLYHALNHV